MNTFQKAIWGELNNASNNQSNHDYNDLFIEPEKTVFEKTIRNGVLFCEELPNNEYRYWEVVDHTPSCKTVRLDFVSCTDKNGYQVPRFLTNKRVRISATKNGMLEVSLGNRLGKAYVDIVH